MEEGQGAEPGLEEKQQPLCSSRNEAPLSSQVSPCLSILLAQTSGLKSLPCVQSLPWAAGAFGSQRLLPQAGDTGFVLCHFPPKKLFQETKWLSLHQVQFFAALFCKRWRTERRERRWREK